MEITLTLFGVFSTFSDSRELKLTLPEKSTVSDLRNALSNALKVFDSTFNKDDLINSSAFANENRILGESEEISAMDKLAILPPVSGG